MRPFGIAVLLVIAGCAATAGPATDRKRARYDKRLEEISTREEQCMNGAAAKAADELSRIAAAPDAFVDLSTRTAKSDYYWDVWECQNEDNRESEQLSALERADYSHDQKQERDRAALMATLLASRPH